MDKNVDSNISTIQEHQKVEPLASGHDDKIQRDQLLRPIQRYCRDARSRIEKCLQEFKVLESVNLTVKYLTSRPLLLAGVIAVVSAIALPVILFTIFAVITVACTFTGFVVIEGTILAFGTLVLCGVLFSIITTILMIGTSLALGYYICLQVYNVIKKI